MKLKPKTIYSLDGVLLRCESVSPDGGGLFRLCDIDGLDVDVKHEGVTTDYMVRIVFSRVNELIEIK